MNEIAGVDYGRVIAEWSLPPIRFRHLGFPAFYATWIRPAVFASALMTNVDIEILRRTFYNIGMQIDFRMQLLSHNNLTFSVGYATAFEKSRKISDEFMLSLKVL